MGTSKGHGDPESWDTLVQAINMARVIGAHVAGAEHDDLLVEAQQALLRVKWRGSSTGVWAFDGKGIKAMRAALAIHDEQLKLVTRDEMRAAVIECRRLKAAGSVYEERTS